MNKTEITPKMLYFRMKRRADDDTGFRGTLGLSKEDIRALCEGYTFEGSLAKLVDAGFVLCRDPFRTGATERVRSRLTAVYNHAYGSVPSTLYLVSFRVWDDKLGG